MKTLKKEFKNLIIPINDRREILENFQKNYEKASKQQEAIYFKISELAQIQEHQISAQRSLKDHIKELKQRGVFDENRAD